MRKTLLGVLGFSLILGYNNCSPAFKVDSAQTANSSQNSGSSSDDSGTNPTPTPGASPTPGAGTTPTPTPTPTPAGTDFKSAGCGKAGVTSGVFENQTIPVNGTNRVYTKYVPNNYDANAALPLVFAMHGAGSNGVEFRGGFRVESASNAEKAIVLYPNALQYQNYGIGWDEACGSIDMKLVEALIENVKSNYCINTNRIFMSGFSWGGDMTNATGCCLGKLFRAVAPMSGGEMLSGTKSCTTPTPPYQLSYGTNDGVYSQNSFMDMVKNYRTLQSCQNTYTTKADGCRYYDGCKSVVSECPLAGVTHTVPAASLVRMWTFFSSYK